MIDTPQIVHAEAQPTAMVHVTVPRAAIGQAFGPALAELQAALDAQGITPTGPYFSYHRKMPGETFDLEIGMPVDKAITATGRVSASELPAATVARTVYRGPMEGLGAAWGELGQWVAAHGRTTQPFLWESYLAGPDKSDDPASWQTQLNWPLVQ